MRIASVPRISIVTPSFNQGHFLEETIHSVLAQDYPDLEYSVVDGGSSDNSVEIIRKYADRLAWWVSEKDKGQSDAINKGLRRSTGDILAWLNSDDLYCRGALALVAQFFCEHPECDAVIGDQESIDKGGRVLDLKKCVPVTFRRTLYSACAVPQPATFFTRHAWEVTGEVDTCLHYQMDFEFFLRMQAKGIRFGVIKTRLAQFRLHADSKTVSQYGNHFWEDHRRIQDQYFKIPLRGASRERYRQGMKWLYRLQLYLLRMATRGTVVPFRNTRARRRATP
jgi:glycosyltransferase involved in cell wall biosynthesis